MESSVNLIRAARSPELIGRYPKRIQNLIHDLAYRLELAETAREVEQERSEKALSQANDLLRQGPADANTFLSLPGDLDDEEGSGRPLGRDVTVEFRREGDLPACGFNVKLADGALIVSALGRVSILPVSSDTLRIERA